ncbi:hypothetical protein DNU06_14655 [Putridiphycobacter roseus]|uniref:Uncharacterized protein n=1 Tax=Putridiphycobacter roseus TaxID=2219161 RepID=A0A2W1MXY1_9FLAO|nr:hypothetical protein [Putridiphycobacter roseus]PZE16040.1 hypothetical protein DNU06_14655 [Putridiphycobacter roseus]
MGIIVYEIKIFITKITLLNAENISIEYIKWSKHKRIKIVKEEMTYNIRNATNVTILDDRVLFYNQEELLFRQFVLSDKWKLSELNALANQFKAMEIKRPFGENL